MSAEVTVRPNVIQEVVIGTQTWALYNYDFGGTEPLGGISNVAAYGKQYDWDEAVAIAAGISGWHLPTLAEVTTLVGYLGGFSVAGGKIKEVGLTHWDTPNTGADNSSGFTAVGAGINQGNLKVTSRFWTSTEFAAGWPYYFRLTYDTATLYLDYVIPTSKYSVRLIKD